MAKTTTKRRKATAETPDPAAPPPAQEPSFPETHAFAFAPSATYATCACGAERDLVIRHGMTARIYRMQRTDTWSSDIVACPKSAGVKAPPPDPVKPAPPAPFTATDPGPTRPISVWLGDQGHVIDPEFIDGHDVVRTAGMVDLSIECSPVVYRSGSMLACDVTPLDDGKYRVHVHPEEDSRSAGLVLDLDAASVRVMRARWLLLRGNFMRDAARMDPRTRAVVERSLFPRGNVPWIPPVDSPLDKMAQGGVPYISIPRDGDAPIDFGAVMSMLSTPGAEVPAVCPVLPRPEAPAPPPAPEAP